MYESKSKITTDLSEFFGFQNITERLFQKARIAVCLRVLIMRVRLTYRSVSPSVVGAFAGAGRVPK